VYSSGMFAVPVNKPLWKGAQIVSKEPLTISDGEGGEVEIPVGTLGRIHSFEGSEVNIELESIPGTRYMHQLRLDFVYYWGVMAGSEPPVLGDHGIVPMVVEGHPDGGEGASVKCIGYWATAENPLVDWYAQKGIVLPWPGQHVDLSWDADERAMVLGYLRSCPDVEYWRGWSMCRLCSADLGSTDKGDGIYMWPDGFDHYVEAHGVRPPKEFIDHVYARVKA